MILGNPVYFFCCIGKVVLCPKKANSMKIEYAKQRT